MPKKTAASLAALLMCGALTVPAQTSHASSCAISLWTGDTVFTCFMEPNPDNHYIHVTASPFTTVAVQDIWTQVFVLTEDVGLWGLNRTIVGLYGYYIGSGRALPVPPLWYASLGRLELNNDL